MGYLFPPRIRDQLHPLGEKSTFNEYLRSEPVKAEARLPQLDSAALPVQRCETSKIIVQGQGDL